MTAVTAVWSRVSTALGVMMMLVHVGGIRGFTCPPVGIVATTAKQRHHSANAPTLPTVAGTAGSHTADTAEEIVRQFVSAWNEEDYDTIKSLCGSDMNSVNDDDNGAFLFVDDTRFWKSEVSLDEWERQSRLELQSGSKISEIPSTLLQIEELVSDGAAVIVQYQTMLRTNTDNGSKSDNNHGQMQAKENARGALIFELSRLDNIQQTTPKIVGWRRIQETSDKNGNKNLNVLKYASKIMDVIGYNPAASDNNSKGDYEVDSQDNVSTVSNQPSLGSSSATVDSTLPEQYFEAWNGRDMKAAVNLFDDDIVYEDTAFEPAFVGKDSLEKHLLLCADVFPPSFQFRVDRVIVGCSEGNQEKKRNDTKTSVVAVDWHIESNDEPLPFTKGCSFYEINDRKNKIVRGIDFVEQSPPKTGEIGLFWNTLRSNILQDPARIVPLVTWIAYMYIVFFSDGILPGANALQLEQRTWEEVRDLSLNFFLVSPLLHLPFSPTVHPMLEGVFNLLLSWAAMFAGFLSDDRKDKPNVFGVVPAVVGMQFLTSAFLLPYLALRSSEERTDVQWNDLSKPTQICESRLLGPAMGVVGSGSIIWAFAGRPEFGEFATRWTSFLDLLSIDRVGSSFLVDLAIFALFQSYFVDDDMKRRGDSAVDNKALVFAAKYVPFFGLAAYLTCRPSYPRK